MTMYDSICFINEYYNIRSKKEINVHNISHWHLAKKSFNDIILNADFYRISFFRTLFVITGSWPYLWIQPLNYIFWCIICLAIDAIPSRHVNTYEKTYEIWQDCHLIDTNLYYGT